MGRLYSFVEAKPKRASQMIAVLIAALVTVSAVTLFYALDVSFGPPYPSEDTPLSMVSGGISWTQPMNVTVDEDFISYSYVAYGPYAGGCNLTYGNLRFTWGDGHGWTGGHVVNASNQNLLSSGSLAVVHSPVLWYIEEIDGDMTQFEVFLSIVDLHGDGVFGIGDTIEFVDSRAMMEPEPEDTVRTVALAFLGVRVQWWEYSYAVHNGEFYAWTSNLFNTDQPWWE